MSWRKESRRAERGYHHGNLKEALLQAALGLIAEKGPAGFTFADAARSAGVTCVEFLNWVTSKTSSSVGQTFQSPTSTASPPRRERSGRTARREQRSHGSEGLGRPYILRNIPTYDILAEDNLVRIEQTADRILAEIGITAATAHEIAVVYVTGAATFRAAGAALETVRLGSVAAIEAATTPAAIDDIVASFAAQIEVEDAGAQTTALPAASAGASSSAGIV